MNGKLEHTAPIGCKIEIEVESSSLFPFRNFYFPIIFEQNKTTGNVFLSFLSKEEISNNFFPHWCQNTFRMELYSVNIIVFMA